MGLYSKNQNQCVHPNFCIHVTCNASISNVSFVAKWCHTTCCRAHKPAPSNKTCINSNLSNLILRCQIHWDKILNLNWKRKQSILLHFFLPWYYFFSIFIKTLSRLVECKEKNSFLFAFLIGHLVLGILK